MEMGAAVVSMLVDAGGDVENLPDVNVKTARFSVQG